METTFTFKKSFSRFVFTVLAVFLVVFGTIENGYGQTKVLADEVSYYNHVDNQTQALADDNNFATVKSYGGVAVNLGRYSGELELKFNTFPAGQSKLPASTTTYVRLGGGATDILKTLLGGSLGKSLANLLGTVVLGNHFFTIEARDGNTVVASNNSSDGFVSDQFRLVYGPDGNFYAAVTPNASYDRIRIKDETNALLLGAANSIDVYHAFYYEGNGGDCTPPASTYYEGGGVSLSALDFNNTNTNLGKAIDSDGDSYSELKAGSLLNVQVAGTISQFVQFATESSAQHTVNIKLGLAPSGLLNADLLGAVEVIAWQGTDVVYKKPLTGGLLNGVDILQLLQNGNAATLTFAPGRIFDKIEIRLTSPVGLGLAGSSIRIYDVKRYGPSCPNPNITIPNATQEPFETPSCSVNLVDFGNVDFAQNVVDGNNETYATLYASNGSLLSATPTAGFVEMAFPQPLEANTTSYVRIDFEKEILDKLVGGSLGKLVADIGGLVLGNNYFEVEAKNGATTVLSGTSSNAFEGTAGALALVQDKIGRYYIAITPNQAYTSIRITNRVSSLLGTGEVRSLKVYNLCYETSANRCLPANFTSYSGSGAGLSTALGNDAGVKNADHAISDNSSDYSEISLGTAAVAATVKQIVYFNKPSQVGDELNIRLQIGVPSLLDAQLLGTYKIRTYNGDSEQPVETFTLQQGVINGLNVLNLLAGGGIVDLSYVSTATFDRVSVDIEGVVNLGLTPTLRLYSVKRVNPTCPQDPATQSPFESPTCASNLLSSSNADDIQNLFDNDFDSYATLNSGAGTLLGLDQYAGSVELGFDAPVPVGKTTYVRIDFESTLLNSLLGGSIGGTLASVVNDLTLGDHYFSIAVKSGNTVILNGSSANGFEGLTDKIRIVQDKLGRYYIALTAGQEYTSVTITDHTNSALGLLAQPNTMHVYGVCYDNPTNICSPAFSTSFDAAGLNLTAGGLSGTGVDNASHALDDNTTNYSEINLGTAAVGASVKQYIFFNSLATADDQVKIKLSYGNGAATVNLLGNVEIKAYNGLTEVATLDWQGGLLNGLNVLDLLNNGEGIAEIPFAPGVPFDRISIGLNNLVSIGVLPALRLYDITKECNVASPEFVAWKSYVLPDNKTNVTGGEEVTYTIHVRNTGNVDLSGLRITDAIPTHTSYVSGGEVVGDSVTFNNINVAVGATESLSFNVIVDENLTGVSEIHNVALVKQNPGDPGTETFPPSTTDPNEPNTDDGTGTDIPVQTTNDVVAWKGYAIANGTSTNSVSGGEDVTYTIYIQNTSNQDLADLSVSDVIPAGTTFVSAANGGALNGTSVSFTDVDVPFGQTVSVSFVVHVNDDMTGLTEISNVAWVKTDPSAPGEGTGTVPPADPTSPVNGPDDTATPGTPTVIPVADDLSLVSWKSYRVKTVDSDTFDPNVISVTGGETIEYTVFVRNTGNKPLTNIVINDALPAGVTLASGSNSFTIPTLAVGATSTGHAFTVKVNADLTGIDVIRNVAVAEADGVPPTDSHPPVDNGNPTDPDENTTGTEIDVTPVHTVGFTKVGLNQDNVKMAAVNDIITYTLTVTNTGNKELTNVVVADPLSPDVVLVDASGNEIGGTFSETIPTLGVGEANKVELSVRVKVLTLPASGNLVNTAIATFVDVNGDDDTEEATATLPTSCTQVSADNILLEGETTVCAGGEVTLTAAFVADGTVTSMPAGADFIWHRGSLTGEIVHTGNSFTVNVNETTTYVVTLEGGEACFQTPGKEVTVTVDPAPATPTITNAGPSEVCAGEMVTLTATAGANSYQWYQDGQPLTGETSATLSVNQSGAYTVAALNAAGCASDVSAAVNIIVTPRATAADIQVTGNEASLCEGSTATLTASSTTVANPVFNWYADAALSELISTGNTLTITAATSETYYVTVSGDGICENAPNTGEEVVVNVNATPKITLTGESRIAAGIGTEVTLPTVTTDPTTGVTVTWYDEQGNETTNLTPSFAAPGVYTYTVVAVNGTGCSSSETVLITVYDVNNCPPAIARVYATSQSSGSVITGGVSNGANAVDANVKTYSTITTGVGLLGIGTTWQNLYFDQVVQAGTPVTIKLGKEYSGLTLAGGLSVVGLDASGNDIGAIRGVQGGLLDLLIADNVVEFTFVPSNSSGPKAYKGIRIVQGALVSVAQNAKVYGAYYTTPGQVNCTPIDNETNSNILDLLHGVQDLGLGVASATASVVNPWLAVDNDLTTAAQIIRGAAVLNVASITPIFKSQTMPTDSLQIIVGDPSNALLNLSLLSGFEVQRYLGDVEVGPTLDNGADILNLKLLNFSSDKKKIMVAPFAEPFDRIRISYGDVVNVNLGDQIEVYDVSIIPTIDYGAVDGNPLEICAGSNLTITKQDECTIYEVYDADGNRLVTTDGLNFTIPSTTVAGQYTYYVQAIRQGCPIGPRQEITVNVNPSGQESDIADILVNGTVPTDPLCLAPSEDIVLTASLSDISAITNPIFHWYDAAGTAVAGGESGTLNLGKLVPGTYTYSVGISGDGVCENAAGDRKVITFTINPAATPADIAEILVNGADPGTPLCLAPGEEVALTASLSATSTITNPVFHWYAEDGSMVTGGETGTLNLGELAPSTYTYSVGVSGTGVCETAAGDRKVVTFTINPAATPADIAEVLVNGADPNTPLCLAPGEEVALAASLSATSTITNPIFHWYAEDGSVVTGGETGTLNLGELAPGTYTYNVGVSGTGICETAAGDRTVVTFTINPTATPADIADILVNGTDPSENICIEPTDETILTASLSAGSTISNPVFHWYTEDGSVIAGGENGTLNLGVLAPGTYTYSVGVSGDGVCETAAADRKIVSFTTVFCRTDLSITKVADQERVQAGESTSFTLTITNNGPAEIATGKVINLTERPSEGLTVTGYEVISGNGTAAGTGNTATVTTNAAVPVDGTIIIKVMANVAADAPATISNGITIWGPDKDPGTDPEDDEDDTPDIPVDRTSSLSITKVADQERVQAGESTSFTLTITNNGPAAIATGKVINLTERPSEGLTITGYEVISGNGTAAGTRNAASVTTNVAVPVDGTIIVKVTANVAVDAPETISNGITVWGPDKDPGTDPEDDEDDTPDIPVDRTSSLSITKVADQERVQAGESTSFTLTITNNGPAAIATGKVINLTERPSEGLTVTGYEVTSGNGTAAAGGNTASVTTNAVIPVDGTIIIKVTANVAADAPATISNGITVWGPDKDPGTDPEDDGDDTPDIPVDYQAPAAVDDQAEITSGTAITINVLANDVAATWPIDPSTVAVVNEPQGGSIFVNPDGTITYTADKSYVGTDRFTYNIKDEQGNLSNTATVIVNVTANPLFIPNVFTPNGDGKNDQFEIVGIEGYDRVELYVFNRWGTEVYNNPNYNNNWDGQHLNEGTYYYMIKLIKDDQVETQKGWVLLKRQ